MVKVRVIIGTLSFEEGTFSKGDVITVSEERLKQFDASMVEVIEEANPKTVEFASTETNAGQIITTNAEPGQTVTVSEVQEPKQVKPRRAKQE